MQFFHIYSAGRGNSAGFLTLKFVKMKTILFLLFGALSVPLEAQVTTQVGKVVQFRIEKVMLPELGTQMMKFAEVSTNAGTKLYLVSDRCQIKKGDKITIVEGWELPLHILVAGSNERWYCYMQKYLKRNRV